jgi:hypothetical protein
VYNHLPRIDPTRSLDAGHRAPETERATMRRMHREHTAAKHAHGTEQTSVVPRTERVRTGPVIAVLALVRLRRHAPGDAAATQRGGARL